MDIELLYLKPFYEPTMAELEHEFAVHKAWQVPDGLDGMRQRCGRVRAAVCTTTTTVTRAHFEALPNLELLACYGPYVPLIDHAAAREHGVKVTHTPDSTAEPVADLTLGLMLALIRGICAADRFVRTGAWRERLFPAATEVRGKTCGIVGMGRIGCEIAKRAAAFDMAIAWHGPRPKPELPQRYVADLAALAREADCLVVTCALTPETRHLIDRRILDALGPAGYLINVARGAIVDEDALVAALQERRIAGAALDVFRDEPLVPEALFAMEQVVLTPHIGTSTREVREERSRKLVTDLRAHFAGSPLTWQYHG